MASLDQQGENLVIEAVRVVQVFELIGSSICVSSADGELLYEKILPTLSNGHRVELSFSHVDIVISAFLNAAIGQLYGSISPSQVDRLLSWSGLDSYDDDLLQRVIENAKHYFDRPEKHELAWGGDVEDEDDE